jgi:hypothetical protein
MQMKLTKGEVFNNIFEVEIFLHLKYRLIRVPNTNNYCTIWVSLQVKKKNSELQAVSIRHFQHGNTQDAQLLVFYMNLTDILTYLLHGAEPLLRSHLVL